MTSKSSKAIDSTSKGESLVETGATEKRPLVKRAVYSTVYVVTFGTVFTSLLVKKLLIPKGGVIDNALHDGTAAAILAVEEKEKLVRETIEETKQFLGGGEAAASAA